MKARRIGTAALALAILIPYRAMAGGMEVNGRAAELELAKRPAANTMALEPGKRAEDYFSNDELRRVDDKESFLLRGEAPDALTTHPLELATDEAALAENHIFKQVGAAPLLVGPKFGSSQRSSTKTVLTNPRKVQETSYWCGPASIQSMQYYFNMPVSQSYIAAQCGTTSSSGTSSYRMAQFLNQAPKTGYKNLPSWWVWEVKTVGADVGALERAVQWAQYNYQAPQIFNLRTNPAGVAGLPGWSANYAHYVVSFGFDYTGSPHKVGYHDPWYGAGAGSWWTSSSNMSSCIAANKGLIIY